MQSLGKILTYVTSEARFKRRNFHVQNLRMQINQLRNNNFAHAQILRLKLAQATL